MSAAHLFPCFLLAAMCASCAASPSRSWPQILSDESAMAGEAEFSISYPGEQGGAVQTFTVSSLGGGRYKAWAHSSRRAVREKELTSQQYEELAASLRQLDFQALEQEEPGACEKFTLKIQVRGREGRFQGCRRSGANASLISRLAHRTEFLLLSAPGR